MKLNQIQIKNWFEYFDVLTKEGSWYQVYVSGHGDGTQIKRVIDGANAKKIIPIHTEPKNEVYHKKWHGNVQSVNQHDVVNL